MAGESSTRRPLFGGAISTALPARFQVLQRPSPSHSSLAPPPPARADAVSVWFGQDVSNTREVPDHQEVVVDPARDESLIFELLDLKGEVEDGGSALWFLRDVANEQDAGDNLVMSAASWSTLSIAWPYKFCFIPLLHVHWIVMNSRLLNFRSKWILVMLVTYLIFFVG
ncbi:unnamed protein product [Triticum turgidum subsp. durum]|uniref:Uncharacterized protein n=1 Tax=Triticum turgidum subsp. durum TaxID=4567 RepID=A0A9R1R9G1_TRITD|nr:unnamed protein product [Triticum turgidum subsp. durum]